MLWIGWKIFSQVISNIMNITLELNMVKDMFGSPLSQENRTLIETYMQNPIIENWRKIHGINIIKRGIISTIWQWVAEVDATYCHIGEVTDINGNIIKPWSKIPSPDLIRKTLFYALH